MWHWPPVRLRISRKAFPYKGGEWLRTINE